MSIYKDYDGEWINSRKFFHQKTINKKFRKEVDELRNIVYWSESDREAIYCFKNNIQFPKLCEVCGNIIKWKRGFNYCNRFCSVSCGNQQEGTKRNSVEAIEKSRKTCQERYNGMGFGSKVIYDRHKKYCLELTGFEIPSKSQECKDKMMKTFDKKYGGCGFASEEILEKYFLTMNERYDCDWPMQNPQIHSRKNKTAFEYKDYIASDGRLLKVRGYEGYAYDYLISSTDAELITEDNITQTFSYTDYYGVDHKYHPDLYDTKNDIWYEVKSVYTLMYNTPKFEFIFEQHPDLNFKIILFKDGPDSNPIIINNIIELKNISEEINNGNNK